MKKTVIIKEPSTTIKVYADYMVATSLHDNSIIAFRHIKELYINKTILLTPSELIKMASFFDLFFIDRHGYILATIRLENDKT